MHSARYSPGHRLSALVFMVLALALAIPARAAEKQRLRVDDYVINAELVPKTHRLIGQAKVKFTALDDIATATFELHNALRLTRVLDANGRPLSAERVTQDSTVRVALPAGLQKGNSTTLTFDYDGVLNSADDSPVQGLKLADVNDNITYLLYGGRWFPVVGFGTNRFTATINVTVPAGFTVVGSGKAQAGAAAPPPAPTRNARGAARPAPEFTTAGGKTYT